MRIPGLTLLRPTTYSSAALAHGNHPVVVEYAGDGNFIGTTNQLSAAQLVNTPPVPGQLIVEREPTSAAKVSVATLLTNAYDADGDVLTFLGASSLSANQGSVSVSNGWVFYTPAPGFTNVDTFTYTLSDGLGSPVTGTVTINVRTNDGPSPSLTVSVLGVSTYGIRGDGVLGRTYRIQYTDNLEQANWQTLGPATADAFGFFYIVETNGGPLRFYRSVYP